MNSQGQITTCDGLTVQSGFQPIPAGTTSVNISTNGLVTTTGAERHANFSSARWFVSPIRRDCKTLGGNLYTETPVSGTPETGTPNEDGFGSLQQGYLEMSNVNVVQEMVNMIVAQRAYEVNSKAVQAADEMMQQANNLKR